MAPTEHVPPANVYFDQAVAALFQQGLGGRLTPSLREKLEAAGLDLGRPLQPTYPAEQAHGWAELAARELFPDLPRDQAMYRLAELNIDGFQRTPVGKALFGFCKLMGPRRSVPRMAQAFRAANNFTTVECAEVERDLFVVTFHEVEGEPWFFKGLVDRGGFHSGTPRPSFDTVITDGHRLTLFWDVGRKVNESVFPGPNPQAWMDKAREAMR